RRKGLGSKAGLSVVFGSVMSRGSGGACHTSARTWPRSRLRVRCSFLHAGLTRPHAESRSRVRTFCRSDASRDLCASPRDGGGRRDTADRDLRRSYRGVRCCGAESSFLAQDLGALLADGGGGHGGCGAAVVGDGGDAVLGVDVG